MIIFKYPMLDHSMSAPQGRVVLLAHQNASNLPTLWIEHAVGNDLPQANYFIHPTGQQYDGDAEFVGSVICGRYVWHVFRQPIA